MGEHLLVIHGGGPTAVINASLCGVIRAARRHRAIDRIYAAAGGMDGLLSENFLDLTGLSEETLRGLTRAPGSAIGTSRFPVTQQDYTRIPEILVKHGIGCVLLNGGNGTMDTCGKMADACRGVGIRVLGIPKTVDNDIALTDHAPGYGSAARYMAQSVSEIIADVRSLPIHVVILEAMGRNAGWITAASALAADAGGEGPDYIYLPERHFDEEAFLHDISSRLKEKSGLVVVCSEGLRDAEGTPIVEPVFQAGRATYFGDVSAHLAQLVIRRLGYKAYSIKPGLLGRASAATVSDVDVKEAAWAGEMAVDAAVQGETGKMAGFLRESSEPYSVRPALFDVRDVMLHEKKLPQQYINDAGNGVTKAFEAWCRPLLGAPLPKITSIR